MLRSDDLKTEEREGAHAEAEVNAWNSWRIFEKAENSFTAKNFVSLRIPYFSPALPKAWLPRLATLA